MVITKMFNTCIALYVTERLMCLCREHGCNARLYLLFIFCYFLSVYDLYLVLCIVIIVYSLYILTNFLFICL